MFFRQKSSSSTFTWQLIKSYRDKCGDPRQRVVVSLGNAPLPQKELKPMAKAIERALFERSSLFLEDIDPIPLSAEAAKCVDWIYRKIIREDTFFNSQSVSNSISTPLQETPSEMKSVYIDQIEHTHDALLGPLLVAKAAWEQLKLSEHLRDLDFSNEQITAAAASVMSRLVRPSSEHALVQWIPTTSMAELLGDTVLDFDHQRFYRASDKLLKHRCEIETHLREQSRELFSLERTILLYDLTNTYFEGQAEGNPKAKRGVSKEKRHDRPLVVLGMIYDGDGFALAHKTFAGNMNDGKSLVEMAQALKECRPIDYSPDQPQLSESRVMQTRTLVVIDAGVATAANLKLLREAGFSYLVNDSRKYRARYQQEFSDRDAFTPLDQPFNEGKIASVDVRLLQEVTTNLKNRKASSKENDRRCSDVLDTILLCRSQGRKEKESAMLSKAEDRFLEALNTLDQRLKKRLLKKDKKIHQAIGRLKAKHPRVQRFYEIEMNDCSKPEEGLKWQRLDRKYEDNKDLFGCYALRTDRQDFTSSELWRVYMSLTQAEEGFRALKTDLGLRPNFHQNEDRVDGHIFITVIAFHLWKWIRQKLDESGDQRDWVTVRRVLETHCYSTLIVPCEDDSIYHIRKPGRADNQQRDIYDKLGISVTGLRSKKLRMKR